MPRSVEIDHYSHMLASLTIAAARAKTLEALGEVHRELVQAYSEMFTLLSHDAGAMPLEGGVGPLGEAADQQRFVRIPSPRRPHDEAL